MSGKYMRVKVGSSKYMLSFKDLKQLVSIKKAKTPKIPEFNESLSKSDNNCNENMSTKIF